MVSQDTQATLMPGKSTSNLKTRIFQNLALVLLSILAALILAECTVRVISKTDSDGQRYFRGRMLRPYALPVVSSTEIIQAYLESSSSYLIYDPYLGWTIDANAESEDGLYRSNAQAIRSDIEYDLQPTPGTVRIAIFGDSFTHGDDVPLEDTWGHHLELLLNQRAYHVEVMNFGVGGYGIDQAFLRWQRMGRDYSPHIVIFGFQAENVLRNLNIIRTFYFRNSGIPFTKPRFVLENGDLSLVNSPTMPPEQVPNLLASFSESPLADYEFFFDSDRYTPYWWTESRLFALIVSLVEGESRSNNDRHNPYYYDPHSASGQLTSAIVGAFQADVEAQGAEFVILHLPLGYALEQISAGERPVYSELLDYFDGHFHVIHPEQHLLAGTLNKYISVHYTPEGNEVIAQVVADEIDDLVMSIEEVND